MATNYLYAQRQDPIQSFIQGFTGGQQIMGNMARQNLMMEQAQKDKLITAMKLHDEMKGMTYDNLDFYNKTYRPALLGLGVPEGFLPQYENVKDLNQGLYRNEQIKALWKQKMEGPKVVPERGAVYEPMIGNFLYPEVSPARRAMLEEERAKTQARFDLLSQKFGQDKALQILKNEHALGQIRERGNVANKEWKPDLVETDEGYAYLNPKDKTLTPLPGIKGKPKAGQELDLRSRALKATQDQGLLPTDPEFEKTYQTNLKILAGNKKTAPVSSMKFPRTLRNSQTGDTITVNSQEEYDKYMGGK